MPVADERNKAVELALSQIEKQFGKGYIVRLGSREALLPISVISTKPVPAAAARPSCRRLAITSIELSNSGSPMSMGVTPARQAC